MADKQVDLRDLHYIYERVSETREELLRDLAVGRDVPDPYKLDGPLDVLRELLGLPEENEDDEETKQDSLELYFDE